MMPELPISSIAQCRYNCHEGAHLKLFQARGCYNPAFIEDQQATNIMGKVRSLKLRIKTHSFLEYIITSTNELFMDWKSDVIVEI